MTIKLKQQFMDQIIQIAHEANGQPSEVEKKLTAYMNSKVFKAQFCLFLSNYFEMKQKLEAAKSVKEELKTDKAIHQMVNGFQSNVSTLDENIKSAEGFVHALSKQLNKLTGLSCE